MSMAAKRKRKSKKKKPLHCAQCGSTRIYLQSVAEGYACPDCHCTDSDE